MASPVRPARPTAGAGRPRPGVTFWKESHVLRRKTVADGGSSGPVSRSSDAGRWDRADLRVTAAAALAYIMTGPGQTAAVSVLIDPMVQDLQISRSEISTAYLIGTLSGAVAMPWVGRALDRYGARAVLLVVAAVFGAMLLCLSAVSGLTGLTAGFVGIRLAGQGALTLTATTLVAYYVRRRLGTAIGLVTALGSAGISLIPLAVERLAAAEGFRTAWAVQGLAVWAVVIPVALFGLPRRSTAPAGVTTAVDEAVARPTDDPTPPGAGLSTQGTSSPAGLGRVLRTPMFWVIVTGVGTLSLVSTALTFHQVDVLAERGLDPAQAAMTFLPQTLAGLGATLLVGAVLDRWSPRPVMIGSMLSLAGALVIGTVLAPGWTAFCYGIALGVAGNSFRTVEAAAMPRYFGVENIGAVRGVVHAVTVAASAVGPVLLALGHDLTGSYRPLLLGLICLPLLLIVATGLVPEPAPFPTATR